MAKIKGSRRAPDVEPFQHDVDPFTPGIDEHLSPTNASFPIVGVGASAGGLEAFTGFLQHLPANTGMAFIFVQHLAAQHASMLVSLLSRSTAMPVKEVRHGTPVKPNHVHVIPPNALMRIAGGVLELEPRPEERGAPRPIDYFLHSLAADRKAGAIGVILSGADSDGLPVARVDDGVRLNVLADFPGKQKCANLFRRGSPLGNDFQIDILQWPDIGILQENSAGNIF